MTISTNRKTYKIINYFICKLKGHYTIFTYLTEERNKRELNGLKCVIRGI